jgi:hypothetical protein
MISRNQEDGDVVFTVDDREEVVGALKEIFRTTEVGSLYLKEFYTKARGDEDAEKILGAALQIAGGPNISTRHLQHALTLLIDSGELQPRVAAQAAQLEEPEEDTRPRGRDGKPLTDSQLKWQEYRTWSETANSSERKIRMQSDPGYATYVRKAYQAEMDQPVGDAVTPAGQSATKAKASADLVRFAQNFVKEPSANLRPKGGFVTLAGEQITWPTFNDLLNKATAARLL